MQRLLLPVVLLVLAMGALVMSQRADEPPEPPAVVPEIESPVTPVLSARRVPELLVVEQAQDALAADLSAVVAASPPDSCLVVTDSAGNELYTHNGRAFVVPASNLKIVTALAALLELGPDHRFVTTVVADGPIVDGVLQGDLIIVGGGDPVISTGLYVATFDPGKPQVFSSVEELADEVAATGITQITGAVLGDDWRYDDLRVVPSWPDRYAEQGQAGTLSALLLNNGFVQFPESTDLNLGLAPPVRAVDPPGHFASSFVDLLAQRGVTVLGPAGRSAGPTSTTDKQQLGSLQSPPLDQLVLQMLAGSDNTTAELLVKELGWRLNNAGTTFDGLVAIESILGDAGYDTADFRMFDGSGLDPSNLVTCGLIVSTLLSDSFGPLLEESMAVAGRSGTLHDQFLGSVAEGELRAKTGRLNNVTGLSGYVSTTPGSRLVFSYIVNTGDEQFVTDETVGLRNPLAEALMGYPVGPEVALLEPQAPPR